MYDPESSQDNHPDLIIEARANQEGGQTIVATQPGLKKISIWLFLPLDEQPTPQSILIQLFDNKEKNRLIARKYLSGDEIRANSLVSLDIPSSTEIGSLYLTIKPNTGAVWVFGHTEDVYPGGNAFIDNNPLKGDIGFSLYYQYNFSTFIIDLKSFLQDSWMVFPICILLLTPGWNLLQISGFNKWVSPSSQITFSIALSLSMIATIMAWTSIFNIMWTQFVVICLGITSLVLALYLGIRKRIWERINRIDIFLLGIFAITLSIRFIMVRNLAAPPWVDSVHHALISRLIIENGGFPDTYFPYLDIQTASYHSGFHSTIAVFNWLSNLELTETILVLGQVMNAASVFAAYSFSTILFGNKKVGLASAFITGFLSPMPAYYTSWGRYPHLAGLLIFIPALLAFELIFSKHNSKSSNKLEYRGAILLALLLSGLAITHYRVGAFFILWIGISLIPSFISIFKSKNPKYLSSIPFIKLFGIFLMTCIFCFPWLGQALSTLIIPKYQAWSSAKSSADTITMGLIISGPGNISLLLAGLAVFVGIFRRNIKIFFALAWIAGMYLLANPSIIHLPGSGLINNTSVTITLFLPISALGGYTIYQIIGGLNKHIPKPSSRVLPLVYVIVAFLLCFYGNQKLLPLLNPSTFLVRKADLQAIKWIDHYSDPGSVFLINPFFWGYNLYAGNDGGFWISSLTDRITIPPPVLYGLANSHAPIKRINSICNTILTQGKDANKVVEIMQSENIDYIYLGKRGGAISLQSLFNHPNLELVYDLDGVFIFKLVTLR